MATKKNANLPSGFDNVEIPVFTLTLADKTEDGTAIKNPIDSIEGYYCGNRQANTSKGESLIHRFVDKSGKEVTDVWGNAALDRQLAMIKIGTRVYAAPTGEIVKSSRGRDVKKFMVGAKAGDVLSSEMLENARSTMGDESAAF